MSRPRRFRLWDESVYNVRLRGSKDRCKVGFLFWPCFQIKLLVLWDADCDTLHKVGSALSGYELVKGGFFAQMFSLEDEAVEAKDYVPVEDREITHILMMRKCNGNTDANSIASATAHEATHITHDALSNRGLKFSDDSEEAFTYQIDSITFRVLELFKTDALRRHVI